MSRTGFIRVLLTLVLLPCVAAVSAEQQETGRDESPPANESVLVEEVEVLAEGSIQEVEVLDTELLESGRVANLGVALDTIPGVGGVRRAQNAVEPVVRGLGWERVQTEVNGVAVYGGCPGRMDPPVTIFPASSIRLASLVRGLSSVSLGPAGTGGRVVVSTDYDRGPDAARELETWAEVAYNEARDGFSGGAGVRGGTDRIDFSAGIEALDHDDYTSADGTLVPAGEEQLGGFLSFGHRPTEHQRWYANAVLQDGEEIDYPALPMNTDDTETRIYTLGYRRDAGRDTQRLSELEVSLGISTVDHLMSNRGKSNRMMMEAQTQSTSDSYSARLGSRWLVSPRSIIRAGVDLALLERDALRERKILASGMVFHDHLWPDVSQDDLGLYVEYLLASAPGWQLRFGGRYDSVSSAADAADDPSLGGKTIREQYVAFYGPEAAITDRDEDLFSGNALVSRDLTPKLTLQFGAGIVSRAANMTERYYAFAPAPNGFVVGNPALAPERKRELSLGTVFSGSRFDGRAGIYYYDFADYISLTILDERDVNGDGLDDMIRGFANVNATLYGVDLSAVYRPPGRFAFPVGLAYVHAENDDTGVPLPEIPALEGSLATRVNLGSRRPGWIELGGRFVDRQDRIDPTLENETPGYSVWHLRGGWDVAKVLRLQVGIENLLDKQYHEHLSPTAALPTGDLAKGDEIPQPGRAYFVSARAMF